jgi:hypothetical protein
MFDARDPQHLTRPGPVLDAVLAGLERDLRYGLTTREAVMAAPSARAPEVDHRGVWLWVLAAVAMAIALLIL